MTLTTQQDALPVAPESERSFRFGYRFVKKQLADGRVIEEREPLSLKDVFFPQAGDQLVTTPRHSEFSTEVMNGLKQSEKNDRTFSMTLDTNVDFGIPDAEHVRTDVLGKKGGELFCKTKGTIRIWDTGAETVLAVEVTSPETRNNDLEDKVDYYLDAAVSMYLIIDSGKKGDSPPVLIGRRRVKGQWQMMTPDEQGRLDLSPFNMLIGTEGDDICMFYRDTGERILNSVENDNLRHAAEEATANAKQEAADAKQEAADAKQVATDAKQRAADADQRAANAEQRAADADQRAANAEQRAANAEQAVADVRKENDDLKKRNAAVEQRAANAEQQAADADQRAANAEQRATNAEQKIAVADERITNIQKQMEMFAQEFAAFKAGRQQQGTTSPE